MPFIGYKRLSEIVEKTEEEVRADKDAGAIDLDDFESLVRYVARYWGWGPVSELKAQFRELKTEYEKLAARKPASTRREEPKQLGAKDLKHDTVRWKVEDRSEATNDPYLERVRARKQGKLA